MIIPEELSINCRQTPERTAWLERLPDLVAGLAKRWSLTVGAPYAGSAGWAAPATRADSSLVVLKLGMPHMEGDDEVRGMRFWNGDPTVMLHESDDEIGAMVLERCEPGAPLREQPEHEQDVVIAELLRRLWREPPPSAGFRPLSAMIRYWSDATIADEARWPDAALVREGLRLFEELGRTAPSHVLLATDLHAGNVLSAQRAPWLVIDPKPFVGDPAYDATQHLLNCRPRLAAKPQDTIRMFAELLGVEHERVRLWTFARVAAEPREDWSDPELAALARALDASG